MDNVKKIEKLLDTYLKQNKTLTNEYEKIKIKKSTYEELIELLSENYNKLLNNKEIILAFLNGLYEDDLYSEEFKYLVSQSAPNLDEIKDLISIIVNDYNILLEEVQLLKSKIEEEKILELSAKRVKNNLKYHKLIDEKNNDTENVIKILNNLKNRGKITNQECLLLINEILYYNELKLVEKGHPDDIETAKIAYSEIPNIITSGFQEHDVIEVSYNIKNKLDKYVNEILDLIVDKKEGEIITILKSYKKEDLKENNYNYIVTEILNSYLEELLTLYGLLLDREICNNKKSRREIIKSYYETLNKYSIIRNYYNEITECLPTEQEEHSIEYNQEKRLIYSRSEVNITKAKIISDMSDISYEYYDEIYNLITKFKEGTLGNKKIKTIKVGSKSQGHIELKDDNARVILKRVRDNVYNVLGVLIKKANNDMGGYRIITNRITPNVSTEELLAYQLELSEITEKELVKLVQDKARKNGRK